MGSPISQQEAIRAMMANHRSVRMEQQSLWLWGVAGAFLVAFTDVIFSSERFEVWWQRALATNAFIVAVLAGVAFAGRRLAQRRSLRMGECFSYVQRQVTKIWGLLLAILALLQVAMSLAGHGVLFYPLLLVVVGVALYVHGLFTRQMLSLMGALLILLGLGSLALQLPFEAQKWLTASVLGLGFPFLALVITWPFVHGSLAGRGLFVASWLLLVLGTTAVAYDVASQHGRAGVPEVAFEDYVAAPAAYAEAAVRIPAGASVPVQFAVERARLSATAHPLMVRFDEELLVVIRDGRLAGAYRNLDGRWRKAGENLLMRPVEAGTGGPVDGVRVAMKTGAGRP